MDMQLLDQFKENLLEKKQTLLEWLRITPPSEKELRLGTAPQAAVQEHVEAIDEALEKAEKETLGICEVCHEPVEPRLLAMDYTACVCITHFSPEEIRNLEHELELSTIVQRSLLPQSVPQIPGLELAAFSRPAQIVGGDFFDFLQFQDGKPGLMIADVAGKGMSAGLIMASVQTTLRSLAPNCHSPDLVLQQLNRIFAHNIRFTTFVTLFLGAYDAKTRTLSYTNAGHNPPLIHRKEGSEAGSIRQLDPSGAAIGLLENPQIELKTVQLAAGDILLLYTDGVTEAFSPQDEIYGTRRLAEFLKNKASLPVPDLVRELVQELENFTGGQPFRDDVTIIAGRVGEG